MLPSSSGRGWTLTVLLSCCLAAGALTAVASSGGPQSSPTQASMGAISGVVVIADSGLPLDDVRVTLSGAEIRGSRRVETDDDGRFGFAGLPAGRYTLSASRTGYVGVVYGQREPGGGRPGTPIQLVEGQVIDDIRLSIPKGGVITGLVFDEKGRPSVGTSVRVSRWSMTTGERRLTSTGSSTTDDRFIFTGLPAGDYRLAAVTHSEPGAEYDPEFLRQLLGASITVPLAEGEQRIQNLRVAGR